MSGAVWRTNGSKFIQSPAVECAERDVLVRGYQRNGVWLWDVPKTPLWIAAWYRLRRFLRWGTVSNTAKFFLAMVIGVTMLVVGILVLSRAVDEAVGRDVAACQAAGGEAVQLQRYQTLCLKPGSVVRP